MQMACLVLVGLGHNVTTRATTQAFAACMSYRHRAGRQVPSQLLAGDHHVQAFDASTWHASCLLVLCKGQELLLMVTDCCCWVRMLDAG